MQTKNTSKQAHTHTHIRTHNREVEYGSLKEDFELLEKISPINQINKIKCPLFIIQGEKDQRVPLFESLQIYEKLKSNHLNVELLLFNDEGHGITKLKNKIIAYPKIVLWLQNIIQTINNNDTSLW